MSKFFIFVLFFFFSPAPNTFCLLPSLKTSSAKNKPMSLVIRITIAVRTLSGLCLSRTFLVLVFSFFYLLKIYNFFAITGALPLMITGIQARQVEWTFFLPYSQWSWIPLVHLRSFWKHTHTHTHPRTYTHTHTHTYPERTQSVGKKTKKSRWHLGMRSQNRAEDVMAEVFRAMKTLNFVRIISKKKEEKKGKYIKKHIHARVLFKFFTHSHTYILLYCSNGR